MAKLISKTYGEALFELALEEDKIDSFLEEVTVLIKATCDVPEFSAFMAHPKIGREEKASVISDMFNGKFSDEVVGFITLIITKGRYGELIPILEYFTEKVKEIKGIGVAFVTAAFELTDEQKKSVEEKLLQTAKFKEMEMHYAIDSKLIGGMVIRIGDRVVDSSISTKINDLQRQLLHTSLQ